MPSSKWSRINALLGQALAVVARPHHSPPRLVHGALNGRLNQLIERPQVRLLAVRGNRAVGRSDVDNQVDLAALGVDLVREAATVEEELGLLHVGEDLPSDWGAIDEHPHA